MVKNKYRVCLISVLLISILLTACAFFNKTQGDGKRIFDSSGLSLDRPIWSRDGKYMAFSAFDPKNGESKIDILNIGTLQVSEVDTVPMTTVQDWSPLHKDELLIASGSKLQTLHIDGSQSIESIAKGSVGTWSEDGSLLAVAEQNKDYVRIKLLNFNQLADETLVDQDIFINVFSLSWSPDAKKLVFSAMDSSSKLDVDIYILSLENHQYEKITTGILGHQYVYPVWVTSSQIVYLQTNIHSYDAFLVVYDLATGCEKKVPKKYASSFSLSPDHNLLVYVLNNSSIELADTDALFDLQTSSTCR